MPTGTNGSDTFKGTIFADEISGLGGNDFVDGSPGADTIDGGDDTDFVQYAVFDRIFAGDAVNVDLDRSVQSGGFAQGDVLIDIENIGGSRQNDLILGDNEANVLEGNGGDDNLAGDGGNDILRGDAVTFGHARGPAGDDFMHGDAGDDLLFGNDGDDDLIGDGQDDSLFGGDGNDFLSGGADDDELFGEEDNDRLLGGQGDDQLFGGNGGDTLFSDAGVDRLDGGAGVDTAVYGGSAVGVVVLLNIGQGFFGDAEGDQLFGVENLFGSQLGDRLVGSAATNVLEGNFGNDILEGLGGNDTLDGGSDIDTASYEESSGAVAINLSLGVGGGGNTGFDTLVSIENAIGSAFADTLVGSAVANVLDGHVGADTMQGGAGNDIYIVDNAADAIVENGGQGLDEVRTGVSYTLTAGADVETLRTTDDNGTAAIDLTGNNGGNQIIGNNGDNVINGAGGNDQFVGRGGNDLYFVDGPDTITELGGQGVDEVRASASFTLTAGADVENLRTVDDNGTATINLAGNQTGNAVRGNNGANILNGAGGEDELTGLAGQDTFEFNTTLDAATNVDVIADFSVADDTIQLEDDIFFGLAAGTLAANQFVIAAAAQDADDRIVYDAATGALSFDSDGVGGAAAVQFADVGPGLALTNLDFLVV